MIVKFTYGSCSFRLGSIKSHTFAVPCSRYMHTEEVHVAGLPNAKFPGIPCSQVNRNRSRASVGEIDQGTWTELTVEVPEGVVFKIFASRFIHSSMKFPQTASMMLVTRPTAARRRIILPLIRDPLASIPQVEFVGKFDILTLRDMVHLGINVPAQFAAQFGSVRIGQMFEIEVLDEEETTMPATHYEPVAGEDGEVRVIQTRRGRRQVDL